MCQADIGQGQGPRSICPRHQSTITGTPVVIVGILGKHLYRYHQWQGYTDRMHSLRSTRAHTFLADRCRQPPAAVCLQTWHLTSLCHFKRAQSQPQSQP